MLPHFPQSRERLAAVLPVKQFAEAKRRLAPLLDATERAAFARVMYLDVLQAVVRALPPRDVFIVTADDEAAALARAVGAQVVRDRECAGTAVAMTQGASHVASEGYESMLAIQSDVPLVTTADIARIRRGHPCRSGVTIVPASDGAGTNALCCSPPCVIPLCFGENSFRRHRAQAIARGIVPDILALARAGLDIDGARDVAAFLAHPVSTRSRAYLRALAIEARLASSHALLVGERGLTETQSITKGLSR